MRRLMFLCLSIAILAILGGCNARRETTFVRDACSLISKDEIGSIEGSPVNDTKSGEHSDDFFRVAQCFYTTAESNKSVSLAFMQKRPDQKTNRSPKDFWKEKFDPYEKEEPKTMSGEEKEPRSAPKKIEGLGDEAYWVGNRFGGMLYVLKGDAFISIGVGGTDNEDTKLKKSKALAQKALQRL